MPTKPCECEEGHEFSAAQAATLGFKCNVDGTAITCEIGEDTLVAERSGVKRAAPRAAKNGAAKKAAAKKGAAKKGAAKKRAVRQRPTARGKKSAGKA
jgi:hypothetical protein